MHDPRYPRYNPPMTAYEKRYFWCSFAAFLAAVILSIVCISAYVVGMY